MIYRRHHAAKRRMQLCLALVSLLLAGACGEKVPKSVIALDRMPAVLLDMHLADGQLANLPIDSARASRDALYQAVFDRHGIDSTTFSRSVEFYSTRPHILNELYVGIEKTLETMNSEEQKLVDAKYQEQRRTDSVRNAFVQDSMYRLSLAKHLLFRYPDSLHFKADSITYEVLWRRAQDAIGLGPRTTVRPYQPQPVAPSVTQTTPTASTPNTSETPLAKPLKRIN